MTPPHTDWTKEPEVFKWEDQGRSAEQIYAVINFLTGAGGRMIERLKQEAKEEGYKEGWAHPCKCAVCRSGVAAARLALIEEFRQKITDSPEFRKDGYNSLKEFVLSLLKAKEQETK